MRITVINKDVNEKGKEDDSGCGGFLLLVVIIFSMYVVGCHIQEGIAYKQNEYWRKQLVSYGYAEYKADGTWNWKGK